MQSRSLGINEAGRADLDLDKPPAYRISGDDALTEPLPSAREEAEPDPVLQRRAERRRADDAFVVRG